MSRSTSSPPSPTPPPKLQIRKLTLFSHGLAQLELSATVSADTSLTHTFPQRHMNDILKSLTVLDTKGTIASITYSAPGLEKHPPALPIDKRAALKSLLDAAQGASVVVYVGDKAIAGTLLGLQWPMLEDDRKPEEVKLVLMKPDWVVAKFNLSGLHGVQFDDAELQARLDTLKQTETRKHTKSLTIRTKGADERRVTVNYVIESPVPKLTYRILLEATDTDTVFMQGWAIVDNPTEGDLEDVEIGIVSGVPMSFRHELYASRYVSRPTERVVSKPAHGPPSQAAFGFAPPAPSGASLFGGGGAVGKGGPAGFGMPGTLGGDDDGGEEEAGFGGWQEAFEGVVEAGSTEIGNLYEYAVKETVSVKARESALVPLIMREVEGRGVDIYSGKVRAGNTLSAVRVRNTTDAGLEGGPVCVYERSRLVGEGMMKSCRPGGEVFVPYSVNLKCGVEVKEESEDGGVVDVRVAEGMFEVVRETRRVVRYTFDKPEGVVYVLHEIGADFESPSASMVPGTGEGGNVEVKGISEGIARFCISAAGGGATLRVTETQGRTEMKGIRGSCTGPMIRELAKGLKAETARLMGVVKRQEETLREIRAEYFRCSKEAQRLKEAQQRFRANAESVGGLKGSTRLHDASVERFVEGLASTEDGIQEMEKRMKERDEKAGEVEKALVETVAEIVEVESRRHRSLGRRV